jgi:predicted enzyme related to lactoylglutathione lyase
MKVTKVYSMVMVADMDRALRFWRSAFDLTARLESSVWSELCWKDATLALHAGGGHAPRDTGLGFGVDDIEAACEGVRKAGGAVVSAPSNRPGEPIKLATVIDTEGNRFALSQRI